VPPVIAEFLKIVPTNSQSNSIKHKPSKQANIPSFTQETRNILRNPTVHYRLHNSIPPVSVLRKI